MFHPMYNIPSSAIATHSSRGHSSDNRPRWGHVMGSYNVETNGRNGVGGAGGGSDFYGGSFLTNGRRKSGTNPSYFNQKVYYNRSKFEEITSNGCDSHQNDRAHGKHYRNRGAFCQFNKNNSRSGFSPSFQDPQQENDETSGWNHRGFGPSGSRNSQSRSMSEQVNAIYKSLNLPYPLNILCTPYATAPDRFLLRSQCEISSYPDNLYSNNCWGKLSSAIYKQFLDHQQSDNQYRTKIALWKYLYVCLKNVFPKFGLYMVGSTISGFGTEYSDVDLCLTVRSCEMDQRNEALPYLSEIYRMLLNCECVEKLELIQAKVPLLKFRGSNQNFTVDLNCNNSVGIRNTHLLYCYGQLDWRVRPLVVIIKLWAQYHNINDAKNMTISSYSLSLMVIHFLQCGVKPKILPCLQEEQREKFNPARDIGGIDLFERIPERHSENRSSLGELLYQFFIYFNSFNFQQNAISVRTGGVIPVEECRMKLSPKNEVHHWKYLCIEVSKADYRPVSTPDFETGRHGLSTSSIDPSERKVESEDKLNFLALTVMKNGELELRIFKKPTSTVVMNGNVYGSQQYYHVPLFLQSASEKPKDAD